MPAKNSVVFIVQPEGHNEINNNRATECKKRYIDKIHSNDIGVNIQLLSNRRANPKGPFFDVVFDSIHFYYLDNKLWPIWQSKHRLGLQYCLYKCNKA